MRPLFSLALLLAAAPACAQINAGNDKASGALPFAVAPVASFTLPWKIAFLPDGRMLVTEKAGKLWLVGKDGAKTEVSGVPKVELSSQGGLLGVYAAPGFARDGGVYLTYSEPGPGGTGLALALARFDAKGARLADLRVVWRQLPRGKGGQFGGYIAFAPDGRSLFLTSGERQRFTPAQDPDQALGKILHLTLDGKPAPDNPDAGKTGAASVPVFDPPKDTAAVAGAVAVAGQTPSPNLTPAETWTTGHRNPYGLAFDAAGRLWETEMGPRGGDELNLIERGKNYGWPVVSWGMNYDGVPIAQHPTHPEFQEPAIYWTPVIAPAGFTFYGGALFPAWRGSAFIGGLVSHSITRIAFEAGKPRPAERWDMEHRIREVVEGPDGALWVLEDGAPGRLLRLTPKG
ncbi:PQQ-dependent sugar dehydrogenase [Sphingomonas bacterium]|uniref:PQQ-dependent sugar dehydrogenase n=1 Tax=Sphingomonas bacterium TaxID=1895847 RepID=UPI001575FDA7|nr:PQQ-dependent sugar dehydrogenase [Sphingomonas bacterium]